MNNELLSRHHAELDRRIGALLTKADGGDGHELAEAWGSFERELLGHFELEEQHLFGGFVVEHPEEVTALRQEHEALRRDLLALGIQADLHCLRAEAVKVFITELHAHATREEQALYRWAKTHVEGDTWSTIGHGLHETRETVAQRLVAELSRLGARTL